jgi:hypothetical protein
MRCDHAFGFAFGSTGVEHHRAKDGSNFGKHFILVLVQFTCQNKTEIPLLGQRAQEGFILGMRDNNRRD